MTSSTSSSRNFAPYWTGLPPLPPSSSSSSPSPLRRPPLTGSASSGCLDAILAWPSSPQVAVSSAFSDAQQLSQLPLDSLSRRSLRSLVHCCLLIPSLCFLKNQLRPVSSTSLRRTRSRLSMFREGLTSSSARFRPSDIADRVRRSSSNLFSFIVLSSCQYRLTLQISLVLSSHASRCDSRAGSLAGRGPKR